MTTITHKTFPTVESEVTAPGSFVALVSTYAPDRQRERVVRGAFKASLARWVESGRMIPVLADHAGKINAVVGHVDPRLTKETDRGLEATGVLDTSTELGARVYELVKAGTLSWSIGFTVPPGKRRKAGKVTELVEVDLVEISAVATPANPDARTLSIKAADHPDHSNIRAEAYDATLRCLDEATKGPDLADLSLAEARARFDELTKGIETRPLRTTTFEC